VIKEAWWSGWVWVGECFFWYRPTRVVPDQRPLNGRCCCCCCTQYFTNTDKFTKFIPVDCSFPKISWKFANNVQNKPVNEHRSTSKRLNKYKNQLIYRQGGRVCSQQWTSSCLCPGPWTSSSVPTPITVTSGQRLTRVAMRFAES